MKKYYLLSTERKRFSIVAVFVCLLPCLPLFALQESTGPNGSNVKAVHDLGYTGQGVSVGLISQDHARVTHEAFDGHAHWYDATDQNNYVPTNHDTSVGGIICSRGGTAYSDDKGTAPDAELYSVKVTRLEGEDYVSAIPWMDDALSYLLDQQCKVVVTGIQLGGLPADGTSDWSLIYDYYAYEHNLVFATAAGNSASSITVIAVFGDTYNSITTGGLIVDANDVYYQVGSTSRPGPTSDGRQKPDVAAPSEDQWTPRAGSDTSWANATPGSGGQTSWSVPHTGGVAAVLLSYANISAEANDHQNEVIKAVIVNSAFPNIYDKAGNPTTLQTWNASRGYGRIDAKRAYDILSSPGITTAQSKGWLYGPVLAPGEQDSYAVTGAEKQRLVVTLTWNRRVVWTDEKTGWPQRFNEIIDEGELTPHLANLDLEIRDPDGVVLISSLSTIDNIEKCDLLLTKTGDYEIRIVNQSGSESANYALAFELLEPLTADFNMDYIVDDQDLAGITSHWLEADCLNTAQPCFDYNLSPGDSIDLSDYSVFAEKWLSYDPRYYSP